jgi:hypothetical protein
VRRTVCKVAAIAVLIGAFAFAAPAQAAYPGGNGKIAFGVTDSQGNDLGIAAINPDGSGRTPIRATGADPAWTLDGTKIAFVDGSDLFARRVHQMKADGSNAVQVTDSEGQFDESRPNWSPDGSRIAFDEFSCPGFCYAVTVIVNANGGTRNYFEMAGVVRTARSPVWSPDGHLLALATNGGTSLQDGDLDITIRKLDGSEGGGFTNDPAFEGDPDWSPGGTRLVFIRGSDLWTMDANGGNEALLVQNGNEPVWSPDGSLIAFDSYRGGNYDIYTIRPDGTGLTNLTNSAANERSPSWQPIPGSRDGYARPRAATPMTVRFVPAFNQCNSPGQLQNGSHGAPLAVPSCGPAQQASAHVTVGTSENGAGPQFTGRLTAKTFCNPPAPNATLPCTDPGDQTDVKLEALFTDIRSTTTLTDYLGELQVNLPLRITDRLNGAAAVQPATAADSSLAFAVPCSGDLDTAVGSTCGVSTTAEAITPGIATEGKRAVWELGQVKVYDGGTDGDAETTGDNTLFAVQGLFAP